MHGNDLQFNKLKVNPNHLHCNDLQCNKLKVNPNHFNGNDLQLNKLKVNPNHFHINELQCNKLKVNSKWMRAFLSKMPRHTKDDLAFMKTSMNGLQTVIDQDCLSLLGKMQILHACDVSCVILTSACCMMLIWSFFLPFECVLPYSWLMPFLLVHIWFV